MIRLLVLFLILIIGQGQAFAFFDLPSNTLQDVYTENKNQKIFCNNMKPFGSFLEAQSEFPPEARFIAPCLNENPKKNLRLIATALYFNILKNKALIELQKQEISLHKDFFDSEKKYGTFNELRESSEAYTQAQIEYLAYKKSCKLFEKQLQCLGNKHPNFEQNIDDFSLEEIITIVAQQNMTQEESDMADHLKYEYQKYKNITERIKKQSQLSQPEEYSAELEAKYNLIEMRKTQVVTKLRCIIYYFSLKEALY